MYSYSYTIFMARNSQEEYVMVTWLRSLSVFASNNLKLMSVCYKGDVIFIIYIDNGNFLGINDKQHSDVI